MRISNQASFFANLVGIEANTANTLKILTELSSAGLDLLPSTMQEISNPMMPPTQRLRFASANGEIEINIGTGRLDVIQQRNFMVPESELGSTAEFATLVSKCLKSVLPQKGVLANRLALIVRVVDEALSPETMHERFRTLFNAPAFYKGNVPTEWTFRANVVSDTEFGGFSDRINTILKIERVQGQAIDSAGGWKEFDRIFTEYDINTVATNGAARFPYEVVHEFIGSASKVLDDVESDLASNVS